MAQSEQTRQRISHGLRRYHERRRYSKCARPAHVTRWIEQGVIARELRPTVEQRAQHAEAMVQDLGGLTEITAMHRALIDGWFQAMVAADVEFGRYLRDPDGERAALERLPTLVNSARAALVALGIERRQKPVQDLTTYLRERERQTAHNGPGAPNPSKPDPSVLSASEPAQDVLDVQVTEDAVTTGSPAAAPAAAHTEEPGIGPHTPSPRSGVWPVGESERSPSSAINPDDTSEGSS